jgi:membrane protein
MALRRLKQLLGLRLHEIAPLIQESFREWDADNAPRLGAALAFYTLLSLAPLLVVIVGVAALVYGKEAAAGQLAWEIQDLVNRDAAEAIQALIHAAYKPGAGMVAASLSILTLIWGASSVVVELHDALNTIWQVPVDSSVTAFVWIFRVVKERFYSFALVLGVGFLLLVSLVLSAWIAALGRFFGSHLPFSEFALHITMFLISFFVITFLFAAIYKFLPDVELEWSDVLVGASITSLIFAAGKQLIGLYLGKASFTSAYGAAGSLVILLVWVYYSALLFLFGAQFTKVYTKHYGSHFAKRLEPVSSRANNVVLKPN